MVAGFKAGFNVKLTQTPRRRPKLTEAEATLGELAKRFTDFRTTGAAFNTVAVSGIFTATQKEWACSLVESQLLDPEAEPDPALFMCGSWWVHQFLRTWCNMSWRGTAQVAQAVPDYADEQISCAL